MVLTDTASTTPMAPPHAEHAKVAFGQVTELFLNEVVTTVSAPEIAPIAPPICATLSRKVQSVTKTMLLSADIAPPVPLKEFKLTQF